MPSRPYNRPQYSRKRSNSVPTLSLANVSAEEAGILCSAAERATARRKRPVSVDSPGPVVKRSYDGNSLPAPSFNFSMPSRHDSRKSPLRNVQRSASVKRLPPIPSPGQDDDSDSTPPATSSTSRPSWSDSTMKVLPPPSPRRVVDNPVLKSYADGLFLFTQSRLNTAAPQTLKTLGLRRDSSIPSTPELDASELPRPRPAVLRSQFSDWGSTASGSVFGLSSPPSPTEPYTPEMQCGMMTPDSFFSEVTPRVQQTAQWTAMASGRPSSQIEDVSFYLESPFRPPTRQHRTDSVTSSDVFSYFTGFDSVTEAAGTRLSNDLSPSDKLWTSASRLLHSQTIPRSSPGSAPSDRSPFMHAQSISPYGDMMALSRTPSWQVSAMV